MTVTNVATLDAYAQIAAQAYLEVNGATPSVVGTTGTYVELTNISLNVPDIDGFFGFQGRAFFNESRNELVIAFTGTEIAESTPAFLTDMATNLALAITGDGLNGLDCNDVQNASHLARRSRSIGLPVD